MVKKLKTIGTMLLIRTSVLALLIFTANCAKDDIVLEETNILNATKATASVTILNAGFESDKNNWGSSSNFAISSDEYSGSKAAKVSSSSGKIEQAINVTANTNYELKAWVNGDGRLSIGGATTDFDTDSYTQVTVSFNSGNSTSVTILGTRDSGDVRFDDFTLTSTGSTGSTSGNLALNRFAEQSSNYSGTNGLANLAVDGNTNGAWRNGSVTHTRDSSELDWWQVRLDEDSKIGKVVIWNRTDNCCTSRLSNFDVFVYTEDGTRTYFKTFNEIPSPSLTIDMENVVGQRVRIKQRSTNLPLSLAEVQVFGESSDGGSDEGGTGGSVEDILGDFWKVTMPVDSNGNGSVRGVSKYEDRNNNAVDLFGLDNVASNGIWNKYFYRQGDEVIFSAFCGGATTENSQYPRSELRGLDASGNDSYFSMNDYQELEVTVRVLDVPSQRQEVNMVQIHGPDDEPLRVEYNDETSEGLHLTINDSNQLNNVIDYVMGQRLKVYVKINDRQVTVQLNNLDNGDSFSYQYRSDDSTGYWKVGCYLQGSITYCDVKGNSNSECNDAGEGSDDYDDVGSVAVSNLTLVRDGTRFK